METKHITVEQEQKIKEFLSKYSTLSESSIPSHGLISVNVRGIYFYPI